MATKMLQLTDLVEVDELAIGREAIYHIRFSPEQVEASRVSADKTERELEAFLTGLLHTWHITDVCGLAVVKHDSEVRCAAYVQYNDRSTVKWTFGMEAYDRH